MMAIPNDLLDQADHLVMLESMKPKQSSLRRAVSAAYYAVFHLLVEDAAATLTTERALRLLVARAFDHVDMKKAAAPFASGTLPKNLAAVVGTKIPKDLQNVAKAFGDLQEARHDADYNFLKRFSRTEVQAYLRIARNAFAAWGRVRKQPISRAFLASLLLSHRWSRRMES
jgi:hypothetical protein